MRLVVEKLGYSYQRKKEALHSLNLTFSTGLTLIMGPNGAGKSTLLKTLAGLLVPQGRIYFNGVQIKSTDSSYKRNLGYVPQSVDFKGELSVGDFMWQMAGLKGIKPDYKEMRIYKMLSLFQLEDYWERKVGDLSHGERRKLALCQSLLTDPDILLADEPTKGMDIEERLKIMSLLARLGQDKVVICATNIPTDGEGFADQILVLRDGFQLYMGEYDDFVMDTGMIETAYFQLLGGLTDGYTDPGLK